MTVKKYTGSTETEAVMKAKEDLGPNAVVLNVKTMKQRGLAKLFKKNYVEITAALEEKEFAQSINNRKPTFEAVAKNAADKPAGASRIDLKADDNVKVQTQAPSKSTEVIEEKLDNIHKMIRNKMDKEKEETEAKVNLLSQEAGRLKGNQEGLQNNMMEVLSSVFNIKTLDNISEIMKDKEQNANKIFTIIKEEEKELINKEECFT